MLSFPANNAVGVLLRRQEQIYFRVYTGRKPISADLLYEDFLVLIDIPSGWLDNPCITIDDCNQLLIFKETTSGEKVLTFSRKQ